MYRCDLVYGPRVAETFQRAGDRVANRQGGPTADVDSPVENVTSARFNQNIFATYKILVGGKYDQVSKKFSNMN